MRNGRTGGVCDVCGERLARVPLGSQAVRRHGGNLALRQAGGVPWPCRMNGPERFSGEVGFASSWR